MERAEREPISARARRRAFLRASLGVSALGVASCSGARMGGPFPASGGGASEAEQAEGPLVTPGEDLMQEHGLLERVLLVYEELARRIQARQDFEPRVLERAAELVQRFVHGYHERLEEEELFPRLEEARLQRELVATLRRQHARGRERTERVLSLAKQSPGEALALELLAFQRMYRPHAAREDTVLFPAFRTLLSPTELRELGERFEEREEERLGARGFERAVAEIELLEEALGLADLEQYTPS